MLDTQALYSRLADRSRFFWIMVALAIIVPSGIALGLIGGHEVMPAAKDTAALASNANTAPSSGLAADTAADPEVSGTTQPAASGNAPAQLADNSQQGSAIQGSADTLTSASATAPDGSAQAQSQSAVADGAATQSAAPALPPRRGQDPASSGAPLPAIW